MLGLVDQHLGGVPVHNALQITAHFCIFVCAEMLDLETKIDYIEELILNINLFEMYA